MTPPGEKPAWPASSARIGPAIATATTVEPISAPAAMAASPRAIAVVATDAISHGARPTVSTPFRSGPAGTMCATAHDKAGSTVAPMASATSRRCQALAARRSAAGSMVTAVAKTSTASSTLMPCLAASQASGRCTDSPMTAAASTAASSGYLASSARRLAASLTSRRLLSP